MINFRDFLNKKKIINEEEKKNPETKNKGDNDYNITAISNALENMCVLYEKHGKLLNIQKNDIEAVKELCGLEKNLKIYDNEDAKKIIDIDDIYRNLNNGETDSADEIYKKFTSQDNFVEKMAYLFSLILFRNALASYRSFENNNTNLKLFLVAKIAGDINKRHPGYINLSKGKQYFLNDCVLKKVSDDMFAVSTKAGLNTNIHKIDVKSLKTVYTDLLNHFKTAKENIEKAEQQQKQDDTRGTPPAQDTSKDNSGSSESPSDNSVKPSETSGSPASSSDSSGTPSPDNSSEVSSDNKPETNQEETKNTTTSSRFNWERPNVNFDSGAEAFVKALEDYKKQYSEKLEQIQKAYHQEESTQNEELTNNLFTYCFKEASKVNHTIEEGFIKDRFTRAAHRSNEDDFENKYKNAGDEVVDKYIKQATKIFMGSDKNLNARNYAKLRINTLLTSMETELNKLLVKAKYDSNATTKQQNRVEREKFKAEEKARYENTPEGKLRKEKEEKKKANEQYKADVAEGTRSNIVKENILKLKRIASNPRLKNDVEMLVRALPLPEKRYKLDNGGLGFFETKPIELIPGGTVSFPYRKLDKLIDIYFAAGVNFKDITDEELTELNSDPSMKTWNSNASKYKEEYENAWNAADLFFKDKIGKPIDYSFKLGSDNETITNGNNYDDLAFRQYLAKNGYAIKMNKEDHKVVIDTLPNLAKQQIANAAGAAKDAVTGAAKNVAGKAGEVAGNVANAAKGMGNAVRDTVSELGREVTNPINNARANNYQKRNGGYGFNANTNNPEDNWNATVTTAAADGMPVRLYQKVMKQKIWK